MPVTPRSLPRLMRPGLIGLCLVLLSGPLFAAPRARLATTYFGRWTVSQGHPVFTPRGRLYKTVDIVPCATGYCGVSVSDTGACGDVLFQVPVNAHRADEWILLGRGKWGQTTKTIQIDWDGDGEQVSSQGVLEIYLGDGHDFGGRSENMPRFHAPYRRIGKAQCSAQ